MTAAQLIAKLTELRSLTSENEIVEFKEAKADYDFRKLGKYFSALCNEANLKEKIGAWLVFGIKDSDHSVVGSNYRLDTNRLMGLKKEIADKTSNQVSFKEIYTLNIDGKRVVMFHIPAAPQGIPVAFEGHYYAREHESLVPLGIEKIERIRKQNHEPYSRAEKREKDQKHWIEI